MKKVAANIQYLLVFLGFLLVAGCDEEFDEAADRARLDGMKQEILDFIGDPQCADSTECRSIAFGAKPCGGPWGFLIYSIATVDSIALAERVAAYNDFNRELNHRYGWRSTCDVPNPPKLTCRDGTCVDANEQ